MGRIDRIFRRFWGRGSRKWMRMCHGHCHCHCCGWRRRIWGLEEGLGCEGCADMDGILMKEMLSDGNVRVWGGNERAWW